MIKDAARAFNEGIEDLRRRLRRSRKFWKLTDKEIAEELGVHVNWPYKFESGKIQRPDDELLIKIEKLVLSLEAKEADAPKPVRNRPKSFSYVDRYASLIGA